MRNVRLLRVVGEKVDTYHDRIRHAMLDQLSDEARKKLHERLVEVIDERGNGMNDAEIRPVLIGSHADTPRRGFTTWRSFTIHVETTNALSHIPFWLAKTKGSSCSFPVTMVGPTATSD